MCLASKEEIKRARAEIREEIRALTNESRNFRDALKQAMLRDYVFSLQLLVEGAFGGDVQKLKDNIDVLVDMGDL